MITSQGVSPVTKVTRGSTGPKETVGAERHGSLILFLGLAGHRHECDGRDDRLRDFAVRELLGTLSGYPQGTRGMIVTTSRFSSGSQSLAEEHNIRLIDGAEFVNLTSQIINENESQT